MIEENPHWSKLRDGCVDVRKALEFLSGDDDG